MDGSAKIFLVDPGGEGQRGPAGKWRETAGTKRGTVSRYLFMSQISIHASEVTWDRLLVLLVSGPYDSRDKGAQ